MSSILDAITSQLGGDALGTMSQQLGADPSTTQDAVAAALPMLLGALARNSTSPQGANALSNALDRHDGSVLEDVVGALGNSGNTSDGNAILGHVLGRKQDAMGSALGQVSGLSGSQGAQLLAMLAPLVMGALGRQARQTGSLDAGSLAEMLGQQNSNAQQRVPRQHSILTSLLDKDGDGSIADDVGRMGMGMLSSFLNKR